MSNYITTDWLNLRSTAEIPVEKGSNVLGILPPETIVEELPDGSEGKWLHIKTFLGNNLIQGFASNLFLEKTNARLHANPHSEIKIPTVHLNLRPGKLIRRNEVSGRAYHLNEPNMLQVDITAVSNLNEKIKLIHDVVNWLNVQHSERYAPTSTSTYCNIYACDVAYLLNLYIPRVWWNEIAFKELENGNVPEVVYEKTVTELNANALANWFENYGEKFGWKRVFDIDTLQKEVNKGTLGIVVAQRINLNRSGHIVCVLPEQVPNIAQRDANGKTISPLQSQAGINNKKYFTANNWWLNPNKFRKFGFWIWS